jgi:hypothetical protein
MIRSPMRSYCQHCNKPVGLMHDVIDKVKKYYCELCRKLVREVVPEEE